MDTTTAPATTMDPTPRPAAVPFAHHGKAQAGNRGLLLIATFKLAKALLFFAVAFGVMRMVDKDTQVEVKKVLHVFRMHDDGKIAREILLKANAIDNPHIRIIGGLLALYGTLFAIEGIGLLLRQRWAEYFTVIMTATGIPIELYEIFHRTNHADKGVGGLVPEGQRHLFVFDKLMILKISALLVNVAILWFLINYVRRNNPHRRATLPDAIPGSEGQAGTANV